MLGKSLGNLCLAVWLLLTGLQSLLHFAIPQGGVILPLLAVVAGVLILVGK